MKRDELGPMVVENMAASYIIPLTELKRNLSFLILGQKGGRNRMEIIELLRDRPYNINQLAERLGLNYRTVKHHIDILLKYQLISSSKTGGYGDVYFLAPELEGNMQLYEGIVNKIDTIKELTDFTDSPLFFKSILQRTFEGVIIVDMDWDVFFWNESAERIFGLAKEEAVHGKLNIFFKEDTLAEVIDRISTDKQLHDLETIGKHSSGRSINISILIDPIPEENRKVGYCILVRDITEKKAIEDRLESKKKALEVIMEHTGTGIAYLDPDFNFLNVNSVYVNRSGHKRSEMIGHNHFALFPSKENEALFNHVKSSGKTMEVLDRPYVFSKKAKKSVTYWNWTLVPVKDDSGNVISFVLNLKETTNNVKEIKELLCRK